MFQLTALEKTEVAANCDHLARLNFSPVPPYAFAEHGGIMVAWAAAKVPNGVRQRGGESGKFIFELSHEEIPGISQIVTSSGIKLSRRGQTQVWIEFARRCRYLSEEVCKELDTTCDQIVVQIVKMITEADKWLIK